MSWLLRLCWLAGVGWVLGLEIFLLAELLNGYSFILEDPITFEELCFILNLYI